MGCETVKNPAVAAPLWQQYAHQFPVTENLLYLNHAAVSPLPRVSAEAMQHLAEDALHWGSLHYREWLDVYDGLRVAAAKLINAVPAEIALVKNTSEGIATAAMGLDWKPGDRVVGFTEEFPANLYPWKRLEAKGVEVTWLSVNDSLDRIDEVARRAKLLAISFVQFLSGCRTPVQAIGEICQRNRCIFLLDAIQGMGAFPLDVRASHIDILAADGHKWMMGPEGCGILYINQALQDRIEPVEFGWTNVANYADYGSRDMTLWPDARRYECGTLNTIGCFGLKASLDLLLEIGPGQIGPVVQSLGDRIATGVQSKGYEVLGNRTPETGAGIVSFRKQGQNPVEIVARLKERRIIAAPRAGWVRTAPHFYIPPQEIDRLIDALP
jgi:selenocysteine lyase/cysteine desulfurase